ncbi:unnamed protein product [Heligmosomoides polygyrus]|uniref:Uncharacterized protein n=1 Tax=Heligmosomoides polygyrus TaxID=6339 RepID=A0A183FNB6_HELPZ|nr:unnamed protein product [Heligmosomoides polygyrus]
MELALRQVHEELRQSVDERWREVLHLFGSDPVGTGCCTLLHRRDGVSDLGRENRGDKVSILRKMAWGQVDVAIEEIGVEVVNSLLHSPSVRGDVPSGRRRAVILLLKLAKVPPGRRRAVILLLKLAKFRRTLRMLNPASAFQPTLPPFSP